MQQWWGGGVWMVVVWGIGLVHDSEREKGGKETKIRERRYIILGNILYCVDILF